MLSKLDVLALGALVATVSAQSTTTATLLIPDWCVTQAAPQVTILGANSLTTYSYSCTYDTAAVSSAQAAASSVVESVNHLVSDLNKSLGLLPKPTNPLPGLPPKPTDHPFKKRDYQCYGWNAWDACIPWEITQGASYWAVHYTAGDWASAHQECTFGEGGVENGAATCTAAGRLDPGLWGIGDGGASHTKTWAKTDIDNYFIRNTVVATAGAQVVATGPAASAGTVGGGAAPAATETPFSVEREGLAAPQSLPTGAAALIAAAAAILGAALAL